MKKGSAELYDLMYQFELALNASSVYGHKIERVPKDVEVPNGEYYNDGYINTMFIIFMHGYSYGKCVARIDRY